MRSFSFPAAEEAVVYLDLIAATMINLFDINEREAAGRINKFWAGQSIQSGGHVNALLHRLPEYWAKTIYYGRHVDWQGRKKDLQPEPYAEDEWDAPDAVAVYDQMPLFIDRRMAGNRGPGARGAGGPGPDPARWGAPPQCRLRGPAGSKLPRPGFAVLCNGGCRDAQRYDVPPKSLPSSGWIRDSCRPEPTS
jgi:hypothetical protein